MPEVPCRLLGENCHPKVLLSYGLCMLLGQLARQDVLTSVLVVYCYGVDNHFLIEAHVTGGNSGLVL